MVSSEWSMEKIGGDRSNHREHRGSQRSSEKNPALYFSVASVLLRLRPDFITCADRSNHSEHRGSQRSSEKNPALYFSVASVLLCPLVSLPARKIFKKIVASVEICRNL